jgi:hypothetical protein
MKKLFLSGLLFLLPSFACAAGFATDPLFLSRTPVTEGQSVHVYAVVSNPDPAAFTGTLVFYDNNVKIGASNVSLAAGATETASVLWAPAAGVHPLEAQLVAKDGTVAGEVSKSFTVAAKQVPAASAGTSSQAAATIDSSAGLQKSISSISPQVASATAPVFTVIDGARNSVANVLDGQITNAKQKISSSPKPGIVAGAATGTIADVQVQNPITGFWYWLYTIYLYALLGIRWLVGNAGVFYPVLAIIFLYFIYKMYRRFRRPAWQR